MFFSHTSEASPDPIFGLNAVFKADPRPDKVNLLIGAYKNEHLEGHLLSVVLQAKQEIEDLLADYLPIDGLQSLIEELGSFLFGAPVWEKRSKEIFGAQTVGAAGALRVGAEFLARNGTREIYIPNYTWPAHSMIFEGAHLHVLQYPYFSKEQKKFDLSSFLNALEGMSPRSVILLHASCHNPTGSDPHEDEWEEIANVMKKRELIPFFDVCYQGFGRGIEEDVFAPRLFLKKGFEMLLSYSCSKNMSLYCQRVGALFIVGESPLIKSRIGSQIKQLIRSLYSNPPAHGGKLAYHVLSQLKAEWISELSSMRGRLQMVRQEFISLMQDKSERDFQSLFSQKGMFAFLDLNKKQCTRLIEEFGVYLTSIGRLNLTGINRENLPKVVDSILRVMG